MSDPLKIEPGYMGWEAYWDPEGPVGRGKTKAKALWDLFDQCDDADGSAQDMLAGAIVAAIDLNEADGKRLASMLARARAAEAANPPTSDCGGCAALRDILNRLGRAADEAELILRPTHPARCQKLYALVGEAKRACEAPTNCTTPFPEWLMEGLQLVQGPLGPWDEWLKRHGTALLQMAEDYALAGGRWRGATTVTVESESHARGDSELCPHGRPLVTWCVKCDGTGKPQPGGAT